MDSRNWIDRVVVDLARQLHWSFLPPLMVYFAAGVSGLTAIVGTFFVKDYLGLSAEFLATLAFWAGLPWTLKMPLGHLVDLIWRWKYLLVYLGAGLIAASLTIMYLLITDSDLMARFTSIETWYVVAALLAPSGYVVQDAVADAMSVEAVPRLDADGSEIPEDRAKVLHTTMQTLSRFALISGIIAVALLNIFMFTGVEAMTEGEKAEVYARIYLLALSIPAISISGVVLASIQNRIRASTSADTAPAQQLASVEAGESVTVANHWYFTGGVIFVVLTIIIGLADIPFSQEIVFSGSMAIVLFLMNQLLRKLSPEKARALVGTAIIIFVFRAVPLPGPGATWFEIDILGFDQRFLSVLYLISSSLALLGMLLLRPFMATRPITHIIIILTIAAGILSIPNIGLYYGIHNWTESMTNGVVDARFIAVIDATIESPLGQIAMIPMLAWIARNAPTELKATFFAVMASFTNLALSASGLITKYLNQIFVVTREVRDRTTGTIEIAADYSELGWLLVTVALLTVALPLLAIVIVQLTVFKTSE